MQPAAAIAKLRKDAQYFLTYYQVTIAGDTGTSRPMTYYIDVKAGSNYTKSGKLLKFKQHITPFYNMAPVSPAAGPNAIPFSTHSIRMDKENGTPLGAIGGYPVDTSGPDILVTGGLSSCSFCAVSDPTVPNRVWVAHIQAGMNGGNNLKTQLQATGNFLAAPGAGVTVYGARPAATGGLGYDMVSERVSIIGVRTGNTWAIWAQVYRSPAHPTPYAIVRVDRVF